MDQFQSTESVDRIGDEKSIGQCHQSQHNQKPGKFGKRLGDARHVWFGFGKGRKESSIGVQEIIDEGKS